MAEGRVVKKKISLSETVNNLDFPAQVLFTWSIAHADDVGFIPFAPKKIKGTLAPMWDMALEPFGIQLESIIKAGLWRLFEIDGEKFYYVSGHKEEQTLKRDRKPKSLARTVTDWDQVDSIWIQLDACIKRKEIKRNEPNTGSNHFQNSDTLKNAETLKREAHALIGGLPKKGGSSEK